jgi:hypothetical protein
LSELNFQIVGARPERHAAVPTLMFALKIQETTGIAIHNIVLRCQIRIEPIRRQYSPGEEARLAELFGDTPRWGDTMKPFLWTHLSATIPGFRGETEVELPVACTYDFEIAAAKYLHSLESGDIALLMMFSGSVFEKGEHGMQVSQIPWSKEAPYRLPVSVWQEMIDHYFPNSGWLRLRRETLSELMKFKASRALATWDEVVETLLRDARERYQ